MSRDARKQYHNTGLILTLGFGVIVVTPFARSVIRRLSTNKTRDPGVVPDPISPAASARQPYSSTRETDQPEPKTELEGHPSSSQRPNDHSSERRSWRAQWEWFIPLLMAVALGLLAFTHIPGSPPEIGTSVIEAPTITVDAPQVASSLIWVASQDNCIQLDFNEECGAETKNHYFGANPQNYLALVASFGTTSKQPLVRWAIELPSYVPLTIRVPESQPTSSLVQEGLSESGVDKIETPHNCGVNPQTNLGPDCDNLIMGWSLYTSVNSPQTNLNGPTLNGGEAYLDITWSGGYPTWTQTGAYLNVSLPDTTANGYGIDPDDPEQGPQPWPGNSNTLPDFIAVDAVEHLPWVPYNPSNVSVYSYFDQTNFLQGDLSDYQVVSGVPPDETPNTWAWLTQGLYSIAAVAQSPVAAVHVQQLLFWLGLALGIAGSALVAALQVLLGRLKTQPRATTEPLAMIAATLAFGIVGLYLWFIHQNTANYSLGFALILVSALFAAYGAIWRVRYRRTALGIAASVLTLLGLVLAPSSFLYLGLPLLAAGALALASILRRRRHSVPAARRVTPALRM